MEIVCSPAFRELRHARLVTLISGVNFDHKLALKKGILTTEFLKNIVSSLTNNAIPSIVFAPNIIYKGLFEKDAIRWVEMRPNVKRLKVV